MFRGQYLKLSHYLRAVMGLNTIYGVQFSYKAFAEPLYRGIGINGRFNMDDYKPNTIQ